MARPRSRRLARAIWLLALPVTGLAHAQGGDGVILDPENPAVAPVAGSSGPLSDPASPGLIVDPENPGTTSDPATPGVILDPENSGVIVDPENGGGGVSAPTPSLGPVESTFAPSGFFSGEWGSSAALDLAHESDHEQTMDFRDWLTLRGKYRFSERWSATLEGTLRWAGWAGGDEEDLVLAPDGDRWTARAEGVLGDAYLSGRSGRWLLRLGQQSIVWGSSDVMKPADVIQPADLRSGVFGGSDARVPAPAVDATLVGERLTLELALVPFFVPNRVDVFGSDAAFVRPDTPFGAVFPMEELAGVLFDPTMYDSLQPLFLQTELPEETPENASAGVRLTGHPAGWDLSLGGWYGWDRFPVVEIHPELQAALADLAARGVGISELGMADLLAYPDLIEALNERETLYAAHYERRPVVEIDGTHYFGKIGFRFESALSLERTLYREDLSSVRRPSLLSSLGASYESDSGDAVVTVEGFELRSFLEEGDGELALIEPWYPGVAGAAKLMLRQFSRFGERRLGDVGFDLGGVYLPRGEDVIATLSMTWEATERVKLSGGVSWFASFDDDTTSIGDLVDPNDSGFVRVEGTF